MLLSTVILPSTTEAAFMGHFSAMTHFTQPRHFSISYTGMRWASMPKSFSEGFMQELGQPPTDILNLWGSATSCQPV